MRHFIYLFFILISFTLHSQEVLLYNPYVETNSAKSSYKVDTLELPFIDDFSSGEINPTLWLPSGATVSFTGSILPPTIGAAQFDAVDRFGNFYAKQYETVTPSDTLCSMPIDLYYPGDKSIYLSFYYELKGLLDKPEFRDSLILQFYSPTEDKWITVWSDTGSDVEPQNISFKCVIIPINDSKFLQAGFQFRFINYTSLGSISYPSLVSNSDFWFIDYIYLDRNRYERDTNFADVALQYPVDFRLNSYSAIPKSHYRKDDYVFNLLINFRNNDLVNRTIDSLYVLFESYDGKIIDTLYLGSYSFPPFGNFFVAMNDINYQMPFDKPANYIALTKLITDIYDYRPNNQFVQVYSMSDFYAYDDGTSEGGYGLFGDGTFEAMVAAKFITNRPDTLTAIQIYFNETYNQEQPRYFYLMVWDKSANENLPGKVIYEQVGVEINMDDLNTYQTFELDSPIIVQDTFFIGWKKTNEQLMNVGIDLNNQVENYKYYNLFGYWQPSNVEGNLMIRPVFGNMTNLSATSINNQVSKIQFKIYPNPAVSYINIDINKSGKLYIYDMTGRLRITKQANANTIKIDIGALEPGVYMLRFVTKSNQVLHQKLIVK